ncbi:hypothetical protein [Azoarcus olearius]|nr:hypothetical protein [Azoarcus olearius]ANQ84704.1 hypothetical protein dqs_1660 [Azoarcus olearius]
MSPAPAIPAILDAAHAEFISSGISINAASCRPGGLPALARATGCRVSDDRREVTVLFGARAAADLLEGVRRSGMIAVVFSDPPSHRTVQLKGSDALVVPVEAGDEDRVERYRRAFAAVLAPFGHTEALVRALLAVPPGELVAVRFTPLSAFSQTPGPQAGEPLGGRRG